MNKNRIGAAIVALCLMAALSCEAFAGGKKTMDDSKAIEMAIAKFVSAYNKGDIDGVLACYADDLIKARNGAALETKAETARRVAAVFEKYQSRVDVTIDEIRASGDIAYTRGRLKVTLTPRAGGDSQVIERRYMEIWRKQNGRWLVARTMDNVE